MLILLILVFGFGLIVGLGIGLWQAQIERRDATILKARWEYAARQCGERPQPKPPTECLEC